MAEPRIRYTYQPPAGSPEYTPDQVKSWLTARGFSIGDVSVSRDPDLNPDTSPFWYTITADRDPAPLLSGFTPDPTVEERAVAYLTQVIPILRDESQQVTAMQLRRAIVALAALVRSIT